MKYSFKIKNALFRSGFFGLCRRLFSGEAVAILRYHSIVNPEDNYYANPSICITPAKFESQVAYLSSNYNIISMDTIANCIMNQKQFPKKSVVFTFDDGYRDNYQAYQILKRYGGQGTFYVTAGCIEQKEPLWLFEVNYLVKKTSKINLKFNINGKEIFFSLKSQPEKEIAIKRIVEIIKSNNIEVRESVRSQLRSQIDDILDFEEKASKVMLTWGQIQEMSRNGMTIGGHTMTHLNLPNAEEKDAIREITDSKMVLEEKIKEPLCHFSYPNGGNYKYYNKHIKRLVKEGGYISSATSNNGLVTLQDDLFELNRIRVTENLSEILYQINCERIINKVLKK